MELLLERCDRCNGQAYVRFTKAGFELYFCGHHTNDFAAALDESGWSISIDTRELLTRKETTKVG